jgi:hypothetical protein
MRDPQRRRRQRSRRLGAARGEGPIECFSGRDGDEGTIAV